VQSVTVKQGFGFIEYTSTESATYALGLLQGLQLYGRSVTVAYGGHKERGA
jgi:RNA recognition motif-containing protein